MLDRGYRPKKTGETVDRRQNNGSVKLRRCPLAIAQRLVLCAVAHVLTTVLGQSHKDDVRCTAVEAEQPEAKEIQLSQPSSTDLPAHDLFWANLRVQLHLPPLDLTWNPVVMTHTPDGRCAPVVGSVA